MEWFNALQGLGGDVANSPWIKDPNNLSMLLGGAAQAVTANDPNSWQSQMGGLGANMGYSGKMAKAGEKVGQQQDMFMNAIRALQSGMTSQDMPGGTSFKMGKNGEFTMSGLMPSSEGMQPGSTLAPDFNSATKGLAGFRPSSTGLTADDLLGLNPKDVSSLLSQQLSGGQFGLDTTKLMSKMNAPEEPTDPAERKIITGANGEKYLIDPTGVLPPEQLDTGELVPKKVTGDDPKKTVWWDKDGVSHESWVRPSENTFRSGVESKGGRTGEAPGQVRENEVRSSKAEMTMVSDSEDVTEGAREAATGEHFKFASDESDYFYRWDTQWNNEALKVQFPEGWNLGKFKKLLKSKGIPYASLMKEWDDKHPDATIDQIIATIGK